MQQMNGLSYITENKSVYSGVRPGELNGTLCVLGLQMYNVDGKDCSRQKQSPVKILVHIYTLVS